MQGATGCLLKLESHSHIPAAIGPHRMTAMKSRPVIGGVQIFTIVLAGQFQAGKNAKKQQLESYHNNNLEVENVKNLEFAFKVMQCNSWPDINKSVGPKNTEWSHLDYKVAAF